MNTDKSNVTNCRISYWYCFHIIVSLLSIDDEDDSVIGKIVTFLKFVGAFINSVMVTLTRYLNKFSRDYRYVMRTLAIEKKQLKVRKV